MRSKQVPSADTFLIRTARDLRAAASERLASLGEVETIDGADGILVRLHKGVSDPKAAWQALRNEVGDAGVDPVLLDESGEPHYPTGEVTVRFEQPPTDEVLSQFAGVHGLTIRSRNRYAPAQVAFSVNTHRYLPELLESLAPAVGVAAVWANTKSRYRRA